MTGYDATTLPRAAALYGPQRIEYRVLHDLGTLLFQAGQMQEYIANLLRSEPVNREALGVRITYTKIAAIDLYFSLNLLEEILGAHPIAAPYPLADHYENRMRALEQQIKKVEDDRHYRDYWSNPFPTDTPQYDKREVLDMVCTVAAREAAKKEASPNE